MNIFISGGCKNGKSTLGEELTRILAGGRPYYYVATMIPVDEEDQQRILRHQQSRRGYDFITIEAPFYVADKIIASAPGVFLVDSLTALLANQMFLKEGQYSPAGEAEVREDVDRLFTANSELVLVSDCLSSDSRFYDSYTETFRRSLAALECFCASRCEVVVEVCCGQWLIHKGWELWEQLEFSLAGNSSRFFYQGEAQGVQR